MPRKVHGRSPAEDEVIWDRVSLSPGTTLLDVLANRSTIRFIKDRINDSEYETIARNLINFWVGGAVEGDPNWQDADSYLRGHPASGWHIVDALLLLLQGDSPIPLPNPDAALLLPEVFSENQLESMAVHVGYSSWEVDPVSRSLRRPIVYARRTGAAARRGGVWFTWLRGAPKGERLSEGTSVRLAPSVGNQLEITDRTSGNELQARASVINGSFERNEGGPGSNLAYLQEAYYFVPMQIALQLQRRGQYAAALNWFRTVYDYGARPGERAIYPELAESSAGASYDRAEDWLSDRLNPHFVAHTRSGTYTRFTLLSLVRCFLEYADAEFSRDTAESVPRARTMYTTALELLDTPPLQQRLGRCSDVIGELEIDVGDTVPIPWRAAWDRVMGELAGFNDFSALKGVTTDIASALKEQEDWGVRFAKAREVIAKARASLPGPAKFATIVEEKRGALSRGHAALLTQPAIIKAVETVGAAAGNDLLRAVSTVSGLPADKLETGKPALPWLFEKMTASKPAVGVVEPGRSNPVLVEGRGELDELAVINRLAPPRLATLAGAATLPPLQALRVGRFVTGAFDPAPSYDFCIPPNPILKALRLRAELNLYKLRTCRNIAGMERELEPYAAPTDTMSGLPTIGAGGQLVLPGNVVLQPTPYRYSVLLERAKQLVQLAAQIEAAKLSALEKRDAEYYNLLEARKDVRLARAGVRLQNLRVREAEGGVTLAELQQTRVQIQLDHYDRLLDEGQSAMETASLALLGVAAATYTAAAAASAFGPFGIAKDAGAVFGFAAQALQTTSSLLSQWASYERREEEWRFQQSLAQHDIRIGAQQVNIAEDRVRVVGQEHLIAEMQADHAQDTVEFLTNKFTNVELYDWMSGVLEGVYSFFLQQASAMAKLAESQLGFERHEIPPAIVQADYWQPPSESRAVPSADESGPDRRGLTGSARLLQDIHQLDLYVSRPTNENCSSQKPFLCRALRPPNSSASAKRGVMQFGTPMEMFDRDFPGHYLRLIKRVRTSVVALIPATDGIKATLTSTGMSRVVSGTDIFQTVILRRDPDSVALTSPRDTTGTVELEPQSDMLLPFEGIPPTFSTTGRLRTC